MKRRIVALVAVALMAVVAGLVVETGSPQAEAGGGFGVILLFKTGPDAATPLSQSCFNVVDSGQSLLFEVCDNDFQAPPQSHPACFADGVCNDEVSNNGEIQVTLNLSPFYVVESKPPPGYRPDPNQYLCNPICKTLVVNQPLGVGGVAELPDLAGMPLEASDASSIDPGRVLGVIAGAVGVLSLGGAAWYARRRHNLHADGNR